MTDKQQYTDKQKGTKAFKVMKGLEILLKYDSYDGGVSYGDYQFLAGGEVSPEDTKALEELDWMPDEEDGGWGIFIT